MYTEYVYLWMWTMTYVDSYAVSRALSTGARYELLIVMAYALGLKL